MRFKEYVRAFRYSLKNYLLSRYLENMVLSATPIIRTQKRIDMVEELRKEGFEFEFEDNVRPFLK